MLDRLLDRELTQKAAHREFCSEQRESVTRLGSRGKHGIAMGKESKLKNILCTASLAAVLGGGVWSSASGTLINVTASPSSTTPVLSNTPDFTFNGVVLNDYSSINLTPTGPGSFNFTEVGFLPVAAFNPGTVVPPGLNGTAGATPF